jgi:hypothetical protein
MSVHLALVKTEAPVLTKRMSFSATAVPVLVAMFVMVRHPRALPIRAATETSAMTGRAFSASCTTRILARARTASPVGRNCK